MNVQVAVSLPTSSNLEVHEYVTVSPMENPVNIRGRLPIREVGTPHWAKRERYIHRVIYQLLDYKQIGRVQ